MGGGDEKKGGGGGGTCGRKWDGGVGQPAGVDLFSTYFSLAVSAI
jgi:hypothetical protein